MGGSVTLRLMPTVKFAPDAADYLVEVLAILCRDTVAVTIHPQHDEPFGAVLVSNYRLPPETTGSGYQPGGGPGCWLYGMGGDCPYRTGWPCPYQTAGGLRSTFPTGIRIASSETGTINHPSPSVKKPITNQTKANPQQKMIQSTRPVLFPPAIPD